MSATTYPATAGLGLLLIRLMLGAVFVFHGSQKLFGVFDGPGVAGFASFLTSLDVPMPQVSAWAAALAEFVGGLALITGLYLRLMAVPLAFTMLVASFAAHGQAFSLQNGGMEYSLSLAVCVLGLALTGPGPLALGGRSDR
jgi:putative oxidoreductase